MLQSRFIVLLTLTSEKYIAVDLGSNRSFNEAGFEVSAEDSPQQLSLN